MNARIVLVDDHTIMREGLRFLLQQVPGLEVVGEAADGRTGVRLTQELVPDIVIIDVAMPDLNGIEAARRIAADTPGVRIIALSMLSNRRLVVEMLKAGARGYLLKSECTSDELTRSIRTVMADQIFLSPSVAQAMVKDYLQKLPDDASDYSTLSDREREVFQLLAEGKTLKEIASKLYLSRKTVEAHRRNIMGKLGVRSTVELVRYAAREDFISLRDDEPLKDLGS